MDAFDYWVGQAIGTIAALLGIAAFQMRRDVALFLALAASAFTWAVHFMILGAMAAAAINVVTGTRNLLGVRFRLRVIGAGFALAYVAAAVWGYESAWDVLPLLAVLSGTAAVFVLRDIWIRVGFLVGSALWLVFNIHVGSIPGVAMMAADGISNVVFIWRSLKSGASPGMPAPHESGALALVRRLFSRRRDQS